MRPFVRTLAAVLVILVGPALHSAHAQSGVSGTFVVSSATDTIAVEQFRRLGDTAIVGDLRLPKQDAQAHYVVHLRRDGVPEQVDVTDSPGNFFSGSIAFDGLLNGARRAARVVHAPADSYPMIGTSIALMEQLVRETHPATGASVRVSVTNIRNRLRGTATVRRLSSEMVEVQCDGCQRRDSHQVIDFTVSPTGDLVAGRDASQEWTIVRH